MSVANEFLDHIIRTVIKEARPPVEPPVAGESLSERAARWYGASEPLVPWWQIALARSVSFVIVMPILLLLLLASFQGARLFAPNP